MTTYLVDIQYESTTEEKLTYMPCKIPFYAFINAKYITLTTL